MSECQYITGRDARTLALFCDAECIEGSSYCPTHHRICWTRERFATAGTTALTSWSRGPRVPPHLNFRNITEVE